MHEAAEHFRGGARGGLPRLLPLRLFLRIDARRPASWLAFLAGAVVVPLAAGGMSGGMWQSSVAVLAGGLAVVAAIGDLPFELCGAAAGEGRRSVGWWGCARAAWPLAGGVLGGISAACLHGASLATVSWVLAGLLTGGVLATITVLASRLAGAKAADAASLAMLLAAASSVVPPGCAALLSPTLGSGAAAWTAAVSLSLAAVTGMVLGGVAWIWAWALMRTGTDPLGAARSARPAGDVLHLDALPSNGPLRQILARLAMASSLAAMVGWLVLHVEPAGQHGQHDQAATVWGILSAVWFVSLAVPQALLQDGIAGACGWDRLYWTSARAAGIGVRAGSLDAPFGQPRSSLPAWLSRGPRLGGVRFAVGVALSQAAILGWPPLVCAVLSLPVQARVEPMAAIVIGLAVAAAFVSGVARVAGLGVLKGATRETVFAATLACVIGLSCGAATLMWPLPRGDGSPMPPGSPSLAAPS